jgi:large exoprotein involved in heme utilization and adhesion
VVSLREAETLRLIGGRITTSAGETAGGSIQLQATKLVHLDAGEITASVAGGTGGNITIDPVFVILENGSRIVATAVGSEGHGGRIRITTDNFLQFPGSVVSSKADRPEFSGTVEIHSPDVDLAGTLTPLPSAFLDAVSLMRERCAARRSGERAGSFSVRGLGGIPAEPDGWLRAPVLSGAAATGTSAAARPPTLVASLPGPLLAHGACP